MHKLVHKHNKYWDLGEGVGLGWGVALHAWIVTIMGSYSLEP